MDQINLVLFTSSNTEKIIGDIYVGRNEFGRSETHCQRALSHAKKYEGIMKTALLTSVLTNYCALRRMQNNYIDAVIFAEEAYNCVAVVFNPVHPEVQTAAGNLIECLIHKGDMYDAERFAQMTLDSLRDPGNGLDQESEEIAHGYYNLGKVIMGQDENLIRAENLTREAYRIRIQLYGIDHQFVGLTGDQIANILVRQGKLGDEILILHERSLACTERNEGPNGIRSAEIHAYLGNFHFLLSREQPSVTTKKEQICLAKSHYEVAVQIFTKIHGSANPCYVERLSDIKSIEAILNRLLDA
jgi:tetratricopeptide (TPR) repeat protein